MVYFFPLCGWVTKTLHLSAAAQIFETIVARQSKNLPSPDLQGVNSRLEIE